MKIMNAGHGRNLAYAVRIAFSSNPRTTSRWKPCANWLCFRATNFYGQVRDLVNGL